MQQVPTFVGQALKEQYNITGQIRSLPGELDLNFEVRSGSGRYVFKVMRASCDHGFVDMQAQAMAHTRAHGHAELIPEVTKTIDGNLVSIVTDTKNKLRIGWLISFLPGTLLANISPWTPSLAFKLGETMATVVAALSDFDHALLDRDLKWDLRQADWLASKISAIESADRQHLITNISNMFENDLHPQLDKLPRTAIHNDANEMNILVQQGSELISGIIDFGDMIRTARVCEPAIAMTYIMMRGGDWLQRGGALAAGFHSISPLTDAEISLLIPLVKVRLAISVTNAAIEKKHHPDNDYLTISEAPAWQLLHQLAAIPDQDAENAIRRELSR